MRRSVAVVLTMCGCLAIASAASAHVLLVGTYHGARGQYKSIQAAVNAAHPGDWILIGPGDYKTTRTTAPAGYPDHQAAVLITKRGLHLRGMNRNTVIIDGTKPGSATCSRKDSAQNLGPQVKGANGPVGLNGVMVWKADNVSVQNLTACNFLGGSGAAGNEIWWNGGDNSAKIGGWGYLGTYLSATSTFFKNQQTAAQYGIFSSNWDGGTWDQIYASNFQDSGFYIGACQQHCNQTLNHGWSEYSALGYSGSNSGGHMLIENSEFDRNKDGFDTNSQNGDNPPPQDGSCPNNGISPITHTRSCWVFMHNYVHDNNNPHIPSAGTAAAGPLGTGMSVSGARNDTIMDNRFSNNKAWGIIVVPYIDSGQPCTSGILNFAPLGQGSCVFDEWGDALIGNTFSHNGGYRNPTDGDFEQLNFTNEPTNCFRANKDAAGLTGVSAVLEKSYPNCTGATVTFNLSIPFLNEVLCDSGVQITGFGCQAGDHYPRHQRVIMQPLPKNLKTMPNPCLGVPANPWCTKNGHH
jgi:hypothetical protein